MTLRSLSLDLFLFCCAAFLYAILFIARAPFKTSYLQEIILLLVLVRLSWNGLRPLNFILHRFLPASRPPRIIADEGSPRLLRLHTLVVHPLFVGSLTLVLLVLAAFIVSPQMIFDEGLWQYIGNVWVRNGIPPYTGAVENKTPGIFMLFAVSNWLTGFNVMVPRLIGIAALLTTGGFIYRIGQKLHSRYAGIIAMLLFGFTASDYTTEGGFTTQTESFMILFSVLALFMLIRAFEASTSGAFLRRIFITGCLLGCAIAFKQIALTTVVGLTAYYVCSYRQKRLPFAQPWRDIPLLFGGIACITALSIVPLLCSGATVKDYITWAWEVLRQSGAPSLAFRLRQGYEAWTQPRMAGLIFLTLLFVFMWKPLRARGVVVSGLACWLLFDFLGANASGMYFRHQLKQAVPALALLAGLSMASLLETRWSGEVVTRKHQVLLFLTLLLLFWWPTPRIAGYQPNSPGAPVGEWLKTHTMPNEHIYVFGDASILAYSERISTSRHISQNFFRFRNSEGELRKDLFTTPPRYIVLPLQPCYPNGRHDPLVPAWVYQLLRESYNERMLYMKYRIFERKDTVSPSVSR